MVKSKSESNGSGTVENEEKGMEKVNRIVINCPATGEKSLLELNCMVKSEVLDIARLISDLVKNMKIDFKLRWKLLVIVSGIIFLLLGLNVYFNFAKLSELELIVKQLVEIKKE